MDIKDINGEGILEEYIFSRLYWSKVLKLSEIKQKKKTLIVM